VFRLICFIVEHLDAIGPMLPASRHTRNVCELEQHRSRKIGRAKTLTETSSDSHDDKAEEDALKVPMLKRPSGEALLYKSQRALQSQFKKK
jgi:hypothetical protein